jgi:hypothetical protein
MADSVERHLLDEIEKQDGGMETTIETGQRFGAAVSWRAVFEWNHIASLDTEEIADQLHILSRESAKGVRGVAEAKTDREFREKAVEKLLVDFPARFNIWRGRSDEIDCMESWLKDESLPRLHQRREHLRKRGGERGESKGGERETESDHESVSGRDPWESSGTTKRSSSDLMRGLWW